MIQSLRSLKQLRPHRDCYSFKWWFDFYSLVETLQPNVLLKIIKSQYALCIISKLHYGSSLLRGWVCL